MKPTTSEEIVKLCNSVQNIAGQIDEKKWLSADEVEVAIDNLFEELMREIRDNTESIDINGKAFSRTSDIDLIIEKLQINIIQELGLSGEKK